MNNKYNMEAYTLAKQLKPKGIVINFFVFFSSTLNKYFLYPLSFPGKLLWHQTGDKKLIQLQNLYLTAGNRYFYIAGQAGRRSGNNLQARPPNFNPCAGEPVPGLIFPEKSDFFTASIFRLEAFLPTLGWNISCRRWWKKYAI
jgi:hypothetical protein